MRASPASLNTKREGLVRPDQVISNRLFDTIHGWSSLLGPEARAHLAA